MSTLTLVTARGTLDLLGTSVKLEREGSIDSILPTPVWSPEYATSSDTEGGKRTRMGVENPVGGGRVKILGTSDSTFRANIRTWQEYADSVNQRGGTLNYTPTAGSAVAYDLTEWRITSMPQDELLLSSRIQESDFEFTCTPFGRLTASTVVAGTAAGPIDAFTIPDPTGSASALVQVNLTDTASQSRNDVQIGIDEHWDSTLNYPTAIAAGSLTTSGFAGFATTRTGAWTTTAVVRGTLLSQAIGIAGVSSNHLGRHRVKARVYGSGTGKIYARMAWRIGESRYTYTPFQALPGVGAFYELDLGLINVPEATVGSQGWSGTIEAYSETIGDTFDIAALEFMPADRYARAYSPQETVASTVSAHDEFDQSAGNLTGKVLPTGGSWVFGGTGSPTDFTVDATNHVATRSAVSDTVARLVYASGPTLTACVLRGDIWYSARPLGTAAYFGGLVRWVDTTNYAFFVLDPSANTAQLLVWKNIGGTSTIIGQLKGAQYGLSNVWYSAEFTVGTDGRWTLAGGVRGGGQSVLLSGQDDVFATGGVLASGKVGLYDRQTNAVAVTRRYDNVVALGANAPATAMNSGKSLRIDHEKTRKEPSTGSVWSSAPGYEGSYLKVPAGRASRLVTKARRNNVDISSDTGIADAMTVAVIVTPRVQLLG